ncbi:hypothetical protein CALCODRAFT_511964 [Calocera cornea HHB12733]|uniref:Uncharacterized protein n=1 Tax=Calocera cornea HHB12733 TaxID=1353952 RepID=A0A165DE52_9BASI|nr:hypothetical protein CALCODRAFT_511964 [Calocera cornea HHB12733]
MSVPSGRPVRVQKKSRRQPRSFSEIQHIIVHKLPILVTHILDMLQAYKNLQLRCNKRDIASAFADIAQWSAVLNPFLRFYFFMDLAEEHPLGLCQRIHSILKALSWLQRSGAVTSIATAKLEVNLLPGFYFQDFSELSGFAATDSVPHPDDIITDDGVLNLNAISDKEPARIAITPLDRTRYVFGTMVNSLLDDMGDPPPVEPGTINAATAYMQSIRDLWTMVSQAAEVLGIDEWPGLMQSRLLQDMLYARDASWAFGLRHDDSVLVCRFAPPSFHNYVQGRESWLWLHAPQNARNKRFSKWWEDDGRLRSQYVHLHLDGEYGQDLVRSIIPNAHWTARANKDSVAMYVLHVTDIWIMFLLQHYVAYTGLFYASFREQVLDDIYPDFHRKVMIVLNEAHDLVAGDGTLRRYLPNSTCIPWPLRQRFQAAIGASEAEQLRKTEKLLEKSAVVLHKMHGRERRRLLAVHDSLVKGIASQHGTHNIAIDLERHDQPYTQSVLIRATVPTQLEDTMLPTPVGTPARIPDDDGRLNSVEPEDLAAGFTSADGRPSVSAGLQGQECTGQTNATPGKPPPHSAYGVETSRRHLEANEANGPVACTFPQSTLPDASGDPNSGSYRTGWSPPRNRARLSTIRALDIRLSEMVTETESKAELHKAHPSKHTHSNPAASSSENYHSATTAEPTRKRRRTISTDSLRDEAESTPLRTSQLEVCRKETSKELVAPKERLVTKEKAAILRKVARGPVPSRSIPTRTRHKAAKQTTRHEQEFIGDEQESNGDEQELTDDESPNLPEDILSDWSDGDSDVSGVLSDAVPRSPSYVALRKDPRRRRESYYTGSDFVSRIWLGATERTLPKYDPKDGRFRGRKTIPKYYPWWRLNHAKDVNVVGELASLRNRAPNGQKLAGEWSMTNIEGGRLIPIISVPHDVYDFESDTDDWIDEAGALVLEGDAEGSESVSTAMHSGISDTEEDPEETSGAYSSDTLITPSKKQLWRRQGRLFHLKGRPPLTKAEKSDTRRKKKRRTAFA